MSLAVPPNRTVSRLLGVAAVAVLGLAACTGGSGSAGSDTSAGGGTRATATDAASDSGSGEAASGEAAPVAVEQIPGDRSDEGRSALQDINDDSFPPPLVDTAEIRSGGPPPDGIPPIDDPRFLTTDQVDWLSDVEPVLVLQTEREARAYPVQIMTWHEIVNDTFGTVPVTVSYCPLCNSAVAYDRRVDDRTLDFGTSGRLYNSSLVMYDRQTESLWTHFDGQAVVGELTGATLERIPVTTVSWAEFRQAHPGSLVLSRDTGADRDYGRNPYPGYDNVNENPVLFDGELDGRLPAKARVVAIRGATESITVPWDYVVDAGVIETTLDGEPILALHAPGTASALDDRRVPDGRDVGAVGVYHSVVGADGDQQVVLSANGDGTFTDAETGSVFNTLGTATSGPLAGTQLDAVEHLDTFWFAIAAFDPDTQILGS